MKKDNELLHKLANNKIVLFLIPNLLCFFREFYFYNLNKIGEALFYEVIILCLLFFIFNFLIYLLLKKVLKDPQKIFFIMCYLTSFYFFKMNLIEFLLFILFSLLLILGIKKYIHFNLDTIVGITSYISLFLFGFTFLISIYNLCYSILKSKEYNYTINFKVEEETISPNIYWIHCDGMVSQETMKKFYKLTDSSLEIYFKDKDYFYNPSSSFIGGRGTQRALVAMFNPYYYDNFFKDYLVDLEKTYTGKKKNTDFIVDYYELQEKRLNNELFQALKEKDYQTIAISEFNPYTSFLVDDFYDFYFWGNELVDQNSNKQKLIHIQKNNNQEKTLLSYVGFRHFHSLLNQTIFYPVIENINYLNYDSIDYQDLELKGYPETNVTKYWFSKAIFKSIDDSYSEDKNQFTFIDFKIAHYPLNFNRFGELLDDEEQYEPKNYIGNYIYSCNLLIEMLNYIQSYDEEAIIVVQADHGIHMLNDKYIMKELKISQDEVHELRNSVINAVFVPEKYRSGEENVLSNPLNISRYLVNHYVGKNYEYVD